MRRRKDISHLRENMSSIKCVVLHLLLLCIACRGVVEVVWRPYNIESGIAGGESAPREAAARELKWP